MSDQEPGERSLDASPPGDRLPEGANLYDQSPFRHVIEGAMRRNPSLSESNLREMLYIMGQKLSWYGRFTREVLSKAKLSTEPVDRDRLLNEDLVMAEELAVFPYWFDYLRHARQRRAYGTNGVPVERVLPHRRALTYDAWVVTKPVPAPYSITTEGGGQRLVFQKAKL